MGKVLGDLGVVVRGVLYYSLSYNEQKPFAGCITKGFPNMFVRTWQTMASWMIPFVSGAIIYFAENAYYKAKKRKNWRLDFADEVDPALNAPPPVEEEPEPECVPKFKKPKPQQ